MILYYIINIYIYKCITYININHKKQPPDLYSRLLQIIHFKTSTSYRANQRFKI